MAITLFGWDMNKNVYDFETIGNNLLSEGQESRGKAVLYLIERVKIAEEKLRLIDIKEKEETQKHYEEERLKVEC